MNKFGDCRLIIFLAVGLLLRAIPLRAQYQIEGQVVDAENRQPIGEAEVYNKTTGKLAITDARGAVPSQPICRAVPTTWCYSRTSTKPRRNKWCCGAIPPCP